MSRPGHNPRYDAGVKALMAKRQEVTAERLRKTASGAMLADGCWSCSHYANHGGNSGGTPPWPTCAFGLDHPECGRWKLSDHPWRYDENWRDTAIAEAFAPLPAKPVKP